MLTGQSATQLPVSYQLCGSSHKPLTLVRADDHGGGFKSEMVNLGHILEGKKKRRHKPRTAQRFAGSDSDDVLPSSSKLGVDAIVGGGSRHRKGRSRNLTESAAERVLSSPLLALPDTTDPWYCHQLQPGTTLT